MWKEKIHIGRIVKEIGFWLLAIFLMALFTGFQLWLVKLADDWMAKIVLCASALVELLLIVKLNDFFL
ncbi:MAG: hypothetical protein AB1894_27255 [Chloroflexota bacterium]